MTCREIEPLMSPYIDQALEEEEKKLVKRHLAECAGCRRALVALEEVVYALRSLDEIEPPAEFRAQLRQRLEAVKPTVMGRSRFRRLAATSWLPLGAAAAVVILMALSLNLLPHNGMKSDAPVTVRESASAPKAPLATGSESTRGQDVKEKDEMTIKSGAGLLEGQPLAPGVVDMAGMGDEPGSMKEKGVQSADAFAGSKEEASQQEASKTADAGDPNRDRNSPMPAARNGTSKTASAGTPAETEMSIMAAQPSPSVAGEYDVKLAQVLLAVDDLGRGVGELDRLAQQAVGTMVSTKGEGTVVVTLKVPVEGMDNVLVSMEKLGEVRESKVSAQSLAPIIAEQEQRLAALRDEVVRLETLIGEDPDDDGIKELKTQLGKVQAEISAETDKLGTLKSDLLWATIQVNLVLR
ncbi:hypothetical protein SY88_06030 [Clostridiales bacterium PH28_bin88]|nr:hypothetical protein SY88_06030 [Clostridiales bacterium PH28_bin88]